MRLEDLRGLHVGDQALWLGGDIYFPAAFHHHAQVAHWHTINALLRFSGGQVDAVVDEKIGVVEWWRTLEGLIALLTWLASVEHEQGLRPDAKPPAVDGDALDRWSGLARWYSDGGHTAPKWLTGLVVELRDFRNSFEHSSRASSRSRHHSRLADTPATANLADLVEAMAIAEAAAHFVRYVIPGVDLMPQVYAPSRVHALFEPLDMLARELLFPLYREIVSATGLTTDIDAYEVVSPLQGRALIEGRMLVRHADEHSLPAPRPEISVAERYEDWVAGRPDLPGPDHFRLANYMRNPSAGP